MLGYYDNSVIGEIAELSNEKLIQIYREIFLESIASEDENVFTIDSLPYQEQHVMNRNWKQQGF